MALVTEVLRTKQRYKVSVYNHKANSLTTLYERSLTDAYTNLGNPVTHKNKFGKDVIATVNNGRSVLMNNTTGASDKGDLPYLSIYFDMFGNEKLSKKVLKVYYYLFLECE